MTTPPYPTPHSGPSPDKHAADRAELVALHGHCTVLVDRIAPRLSDSDQRRVRTTLHAGEWLYLLNDLCAALLDDHIPLTPDEHTHLTAAIDLVGLGDDTAPRLRDPDTTLAAIIVG